MKSKIDPQLLNPLSKVQLHASGNVWGLMDKPPEDFDPEKDLWIEDLKEENVSDVVAFSDQALKQK